MCSEGIGRKNMLEHVLREGNPGEFTNILQSALKVICI